MRTMRQADAQAGVDRAERNFRLLWIGQGISMVGSEVTKLAVPLLALHELHAGSAQVGLLRAGSTTPALDVTLFVGVFVDRMRRRTLLVTTNLAQAALLIAVVALVAGDHLDFPALVVASFVLGVASVFFDVAYPTFVPTVVPRDLLTTANSRLFGAQSVAEAVGPGIAGLLVARFGAAWALLLDAASFLVSAGTLLALRVREAAVPLSRPRFVSEIRSGMRATLGHPLLRPLIVSVGISNFWDSAANTVFLVYAVRELGLSTSTVGLVLGAGSVGAIVGSMCSTPVVGRFGLGRTIAGVVVLASAASFLLLVPRNSQPWSIAVLVVAYAGWTLCDAIYSIQSVSIRQAATPERMRGRVAATGWVFILGSIPLGALAGGALGELIGLWPALAVSLIGMLPALGVLLRSPVVRLASLPEVDELYWSRFA